MSTETTTELDKNKSDYNRNPDGKGGFQERPETINKGGRPKNEVSIVYWMKEYLKGCEEGHAKDRAQEFAEDIVKEAKRTKNPALVKEVIERIEGKVPQKLEGEIVGLKELAETIQKLVTGEIDEPNEPSNQDAS